MDSSDLWIIGMGLSPVWVPGLGMLAWLLVHEARKRLLPPQRLVSLVVDLLGVSSGWSIGPTTVRHHTGVMISLRYDNTVQAIEVDGARLPLRLADRFCVARAIAALRQRRQAVADAEAAEVLKRRAHEFARRVERFADSAKAGP